MHTFLGQNLKGEAYLNVRKNMYEMILVNITLFQNESIKPIQMFPFEYYLNCAHTCNYAINFCNKTKKIVSTTFLGINC